MALLSVTLAVTSPSTGFAAFSVAHGLPSVPTSVQVQMTSGGVIWPDATVEADAANVYLHASDAGLTAMVTAAGPTLSTTGQSAYTTLAAICGMFPTFTRNGAKGPSDALIQQYIYDIAAEIDAILQRRFQEAMGSLSFTAWQAGITADQLNVLECTNRFGACAELAIDFETAGIASASRVAKRFEDKYAEAKNTLNARDAKGKPLTQGGDWDYLFDSQAKVETPRPQLGGASGGDQYPSETPSEGTTSVFKKWDRTEF